MAARGEPVSVCALGAELGEGPVWDGRDECLWCVDIKQRKVHRFDPSTRGLTSWDAPAEIGWVLPARSGGFAAGLQDGLYRFDPASGAFTLLHRVDADRPGNRLNDACTDAAGRLWFGTMDNAEAADSGRFFTCWRGVVTPLDLPARCITNGPAVSPDGRLLYHTDTLGRTINVAEVDEDGGVRPPRPFVRIEDGAGFPDGPVVDSEGCVWTGLYGGWAARRYTPDGRLLEEVRFPVANVTKLAFGGADLRTVYATTARMGLSAEALAAQPQAGNLFAFEADVAGVPVTEADL